MSTEENKALVAAFWEKFSASDFDAGLAMLSDDATWWVSGTTPISGTYSKSEFAELLGQIGPQAPNGIRVTPTQFTAEDNRVSMEATSHGEISNGNTYQNIYHFMFECGGGKITAVREYMDTEHVTATFFGE